MRQFRHWLSPLVHLANNWISLIGVILVTSATVFWLWLLPVTMRHEVDNPYTGILAFMIVPGGFFLGLALIPLGIGLQFRSERKRGQYPVNFPPLNYRNLEFRRLINFVAAATAVNVVLAGQLSYKAVTYMDGVTFCGQTCHTVMTPEFTAYQNSPHSRVECTKCHIGPGASWFVKSKLAGVRQVFAVTLNTYSRPIPAPVHNLRPARETCEACHWPQKFGADRLRVIEKFAEDEANTLSKTVLLMRIGGGHGGPGIHGAHLGQGILIRYAHSDEKRETIPWVESTNAKGEKTVFVAAGAKPGDIQKMPVRVMDCVDCHNRPTHAYELPERALDRALSNGSMSRTLPLVKSKGLEILKKSYSSHGEAEAAIPVALENYYRESHPSVYAGRRAEIQRAGKALVALYTRNVFPEMKVTWGTYSNHIGHTDFPGCFRCHDDAHTSAAGKSIPQDCNTCHQLLAMDEPAPKILADLGLATDGAK
jgi:nitrate/TMAO reductase-like tetraheme cytochrome c subunit